MDIAALNLEARSDSVKQATVDLKAMVPAASAAERAAKRWGMTTSAAARSSEDFSKRVNRTIKDLEFERQQLMRNAAEKQRYAALQRAGVTAHSAEGRAITAAVQALQAQRTASAAAAKSMQSVGTTAAFGTGAVGLLARSFGPLAAGLSAATVAGRVWSAGMKAADMGEQAEQIGLTTDQLQAYRLVAAQSGVQAEQLDAAMTKLTRSMGSANDGNKEMIDLFGQLGVKLLDSNGMLRKSADVMPEVAAGLLKVGSETQRNAMLQDLFGRSGMKMVTILEQLAQGNDAVVESARRQGAIMSKETIATWDKLGDALVVAGQQLDTILATFAAPVATTALDQITAVLKSTRAELEMIQKALAWIGGRAGSGVSLEDMQAEASQVQSRIDKLSAQDRTTGRDALLQREYARLGVLQQGISDQQTAAYMPPVTVTADAPGVRNPASKGGGSDPYAKAIEGAKQYIAAKNAETAAIGLSAEAASRLKHEQDLLNKVTSDGRTVTDAQRQALQDLAKDMAAADAALATGKFMEDAKVRSEEFLAQQQVERDSIFLSTEAAAKLRYEMEMINLAKQQGNELTPEQTQTISDYAGQMASAEARTRGLREAFDFAKGTAKGFFMDLKQGLQEGQSIWDAFANAGLNALNKIADKLLEMAIDSMISSLFNGLGGMGGGMGGGGGLGGLIGSAIMSLFADGAAFRNGAVLPYARGGAFYAGAEQRFATGGAIVNRPTTFPMAGNRRGLMGEAGPEAIVPLHRGADGGLGIRMTGRRGGGGDGDGQQPVVVHVYANEGFVRAEAEGAAVRVVNNATPGIVGQSVKKANEQAPGAVARHEAQRGGEWR